MAWTALAGAASAQTGPKDAGEKPANADDALTLSQIREQQFMLRLLVDPKQELNDRRQAVVSLLDRDTSDVEAQLIDLLSSDVDPLAQRAVAQGIAAAIGQPSDAFAPVLFKLLGTVQEPLLEDVAAALGRYGNHAVARQVEAAATDPNAPDALRHGAIRTLIYHRSKAATSTLMKLVASDRPQSIRDEAFDALGQLTGVTEYGRDLLRWQRWWREYQRLPDTEWYARIINNVEARNRRLKEDALATQARFIETQRQLFRATPQADRPAALIALLNDPQPALRQLGMDLTLQLRVDGGQIGQDLRDKVIAKLDDPTPSLRASAAKLLLGLADSQGAAAVAVRLANVNVKETDPAVLKAYLALLGKLPQAKGVGPILELLGQPSLRVDAAAALAAAADQGLVESSLADRAAARLRQQLTDDRLPEPQLIVLLGRIGNNEDWQRIEGWLSATDDQVKAAAARAWSESADRPLATLARKANDPIILPFLIAGATRRGNDEVTLNALIEHAPKEDEAQLYAAWRQALVSMAQQKTLAPPLFIAADTALKRGSVAAPVRVQMLSAVIDRVMAALALNPKDPLGAHLQPLLLARAEAKLDADDTQGALTDLQRVTSPDLLTPAQRRQRSLALIRADLAAGRVDAALAEGERLLGPTPGPGRTDAVVTAVADIFLAAASRGIDAKQAEQAEQILAGVVGLLTPGVPESVTEQVAQLRAKNRATPTN